MNLRRKFSATILIDVGPLVNGSKSGIGYYVFGLLKTLAAEFPDYLFVGHYYNFLGRKRHTILPQAPNISYRQSRLIPGRATNLLRRLGVDLPIEMLAKKRASFIIFPAYLTQPSLFKTPMTVMIHDMAYLDMPDTLAPRNLHDLVRFVPKSIERSVFVTTISNSTLKRIQARYPNFNNPGIVTHIPPTLINPIQTKETLKPFGINKSFILFVGNLEPRKNIVGLVRAYCSMGKQLTDKYQLVLAGGKGWNDDLIEKTIKKRQKDGFDIITTGYVSDSQRNLLYSKATMLAFVSFYEGFGMPVLEAMQFGAPVLCSDIEVLREVAGDAALYCNPHDVAGISAKLTGLLDSKEKRAKLEALGKQRVATFTWENSTLDLRNKIRQIVSGTNEDL